MRKPLEEKGVASQFKIRKSIHAVIAKVFDRSWASTQRVRGEPASSVPLPQHHQTFAVRQLLRRFIVNVEILLLECRDRFFDISSISTM